MSFVKHTRTPLYVKWYLCILGEVREAPMQLEALALVDPIIILELLVSVEIVV